MHIFKRNSALVHIHTPLSLKYRTPPAPPPHHHSTFKPAKCARPTKKRFQPDCQYKYQKWHFFLARDNVDWLLAQNSCDFYSWPRRVEWYTQQFSGESRLPFRFPLYLLKCIWDLWDMIWSWRRLSNSFYCLSQIMEIWNRKCMFARGKNDYILLEFMNGGE